MAKTVDSLFVYGTLRRDARHASHAMLARGATLLGDATLNGAAIYLVGEYPGVVPSDNQEDVVHGEVYRFDPKSDLLTLLDEYEGCLGPRPLYTREPLPVTLAQGETVTAWVYVYNHPVSKKSRIASGDFLFPYG
ncbi:Gamma-glutamylcyclotransferase family protein YtfP [Pirellulimonas nuda]|uniref:Gamma-glutamylcyclotransferase family protein n=1 Tax=Pirellulimonas nuda TaxID=2528009 RepID=A0A518DFF5_9BACT|nr:gamma-glutamylcyclotransferase family protein [Pirellulimonas nuda]QDU90209.1 Gamma-glutamylcyclotransferase family protein YtfP [Pirellulimonas nuda]